MQLTAYHAKYFAHELTKRSASDSIEKLAGALVDAQVDLNPHQIDAALFAFKSPLSKGALLADEVGLGKTIEAGLVVSQRWAERRRRILVITPANLRKQWHQELSEKFFLPCAILESKSYNQVIKQGNFRPFQPTGKIVICSYQFACSKSADVNATAWDLVVIDEAHRLRNVYKPSNVIANTLKQALAQFPILLLTATPLQNSLSELFGLVSFIDEHTFGDLKSFREKFANLDQDGVFETLRARLKPICHRTLRRQVTAYVPYTRRLPIVEPFTPDESEDRLYNLVSDYLCRENLQALPAGQRSLITLVLRKLLASSTFAIAGALTSMANRLRARLKADEPHLRGLADELDEDYEALDQTAEEWPEDEPHPITEAGRVAIEREIADLEGFRDLAVSIKHNAKGRALLKALAIAFAKAKDLGAAQKAIIFTESRRTQDYLLRVLADSPWKDGIVLFNGSNTDERSRQIYSAWLDKHRGTDRVSGSRTADMRSAIVEYFEKEGRIMIATEAGAEGINLQFCSLVVNYDLPWNPQRIEQRIGRCHRYGQKHDVVVVNFLNKKNQADQRVFELLSEKFKLFEGVFGASDEVLGAIESGVDFEKRIADIYQRCRRPEEIQAAFDQLQRELNDEISESMTRTRQKLLDNFDDEVREKLKVRDADSRASLNRFERLLMQITEHELAGHAEFHGDGLFQLRSCPFPGDIPLGQYELPRRSGEAHLYRMNHQLAIAVVDQAANRDLPVACLTFDYAAHEGVISVLKPLIGLSGWLELSKLTVESFASEDFLVFAARTDDGQVLDDDACRKLFQLPARAETNRQIAENADHITGKENLRDRGVLAVDLSELRDREIASRVKAVEVRNAAVFEAEVLKLDGWSDDLKLGLERQLKDLDRQIREARKVASLAASLQDKLQAQKVVKALEAERSRKRRELFDAQDAIDRQRDDLIKRIEEQLKQRRTVTQLFMIRWHLVASG